MVTDRPLDDLVVDHEHAPELADDQLRQLLGGKADGLVRMAAHGLPVPPGFTLTTEAFRTHRQLGWVERLDAALTSAIGQLEVASGRRLGDAAAPLLVSVRSGAPVSMPGMMDTVLNVGMTDAIVDGLRSLDGDAFASDTARRAHESFCEVVGTDPPADPLDQIRAAVVAVFESWDSDRAREYRRVEGIADELGTAVTVQAMVFGNRGSRSGTGVAFSRDPATGARGLMGDYLPGAQGEDVVSGRMVTMRLDEMQQDWPQHHAELARIAGVLEQLYADMVDIEFTIEGDVLWLLQVRPGKRSPIATFRMAIDMAEDPAFPVDRALAVERCRRWLAAPPRAVGGATSEVVLATGLAASPGVGTGQLCLEPDEAVELDAAGEPVVLARTETSPADVHGMAVASGLFTTRGGLVSHAAVVARDWGIPAVVGAEDAVVERNGIRVGDRFVAAGSVVTVDGDRGVLLLGDGESEGAIAPEVEIVRRWADEIAGA